MERDNLDDRDLWVLDIETTGLDGFSDRLLCVGVLNQQDGIYFYFDELATFKSWLKPSHRFVCHNGRFDVNFLRRLGVDLRNAFTWDTRSLATLLIPRPPLAEGQAHHFALENLYIKLLYGSAYKVDRTAVDQLSHEELERYNRMDCEITGRLFSYFKDALTAKDWEFASNWLMPATKLCAELEYNGVLIDWERLEAFSLETEKKLAEVKEELEKLTEKPRRLFYEDAVKDVSATYAEMFAKAFVKAKDKEGCRRRYQALEQNAKAKIEPFNFNSNQQLTWLLKCHYGLDLFNKRSEKETTDEAMLKSHAGRGSAVCEALLRFREVEKLATSCIPAFRDNRARDNRVHPSFNVGGTRTGRLSSSSPNFQQVPRGPLRECVIAPEGSSLFVADYAQIEVRILAELAQEESLINAFKEGIDPYSVIAKKLFKIEGDVKEIKKTYSKERNVAKTAGLSILYGTGPKKLQEMLEKELGRKFSVQECKCFIEEYRASFPAIGDLKTELEGRMFNSQRFHNLLGRACHVDRNEDLYMKCLNTLVQSSASDLVIHAALKLQKAFPELKPVLLVHDEMVFEMQDYLATKVDIFVKILTDDIKEELGMETPLAVECKIAKCWEKL